MRVEIRRIGPAEEENAVISVAEMTDSIRNAVDLLENQCRTIPVVSDGKTMMCRTDQIYYIESVDKRSFVYTKAGCYETRHRLYELEELLDARFLRCAKAMIINIRKIRSVKGELNGRMRAEMLNGEQIIISRGYVKELKERLGV
ncbi:MAG: LytTR family transcriptional regulator DNA-binding domain-containing protein [Clostridia bacterium]|nr:LytTR family transcriptional regulator DNA-binding domain-containing protein [Clostridia bacterium]